MYYSYIPVNILSSTLATFFKNVKTTVTISILSPFLAFALFFVLQFCDVLFLSNSDTYRTTYVFYGRSFGKKTHFPIQLYRTFRTPERHEAELILRLSYPGEIQQAFCKILTAIYNIAMIISGSNA